MRLSSLLELRTMNAREIPKSIQQLTVGVPDIDGIATIIRRIIALEYALLASIAKRE